MTSDLHNNKVAGISASPLGNLPQDMPIFLGREAEIVKIKNFLDEKHLVTLCGTDGVGKTRLALQVAAEMQGQFGDGVFFVPLVSIDSPEAMVDEIAKILGIKINPRFD